VLTSQRLMCRSFGNKDLMVIQLLAHRAEHGHRR
jgi:hypothetical protein